MHAEGIELCFAEMKDPVKDKLKRFEPFARFGAETFYATLGAAVKAYLGSHPVEWVDWDNEPRRLAWRLLLAPGTARMDYGSVASGHRHPASRNARAC